MIPCYDCGAALKAKTAPVKGVYGGESYTVRAKALVCAKCGYTTVDGVHLDEYSRAVADAYRKAHKLLTSTQIRGTRLKLKMSQRQFAQYLGVGIASLKRWELGKVQDHAMNELIKLKTDLVYSRQNNSRLLAMQGLRP